MSRIAGVPEKKNNIPEDTIQLRDSSGLLCHADAMLAISMIEIIFYDLLWEHELDDAVLIFMRTSTPEICKVQYCLPV